MYRCFSHSNSTEYQWIAAKSLEEAKMKAASLFPNVSLDSIHVEQDQDALDTWFSSGLLPISIFHNQNPQEFPTTLLDTGYDIMFFWVARMVMLVIIISDRIILSNEISFSFFLEFKINESNSISRSSISWSYL